MNTRAIIFLSVCLFFAFWYSDLKSQDINEGLVAYYPLNGSLIDSTGNSNDVINYPNPRLFMTGLNGSLKSALLFYTPRGYLYGDTKTFPVDSSDRSISLWYKTNNFFEHQCLISWGDTNVYHGIQFGYGYGSCVYAFRYGDNNKYIESRYCDINDNDLRINAEWIHLCAIYSNDTAYLYFNGELFDYGFIGNINTPDDMFCIGGLIDGRNDFWGSPTVTNIFDGVIDEVRIYNRALDSAEIQILATRHARTDTITQIIHDTVWADTLVVTETEYINDTLHFEFPYADGVNPISYKEVWIAPNPTNEYLFIQTNGVENHREYNLMKVEIINLQGTVVYSYSSGWQQLLIEVDNFSRGLYIVNVYTENDELVTSKKILFY